MAQDVAESEGFSSLKPSTKDRRNQHLEEFISFVKSYVLKRGEEDLSQAVLLQLSFPSDQTEFVRYCKYWVVKIMRTATGRSVKDDSISAKAMKSYRHSMCHWAKELYSKRGQNPPEKDYLFSAMTQVIRYVAQKLDIMLEPPHSSRSYLGLPELKQLMDMDHQKAYSIEVSQQYHLCWLLGRFLALRPGSTGKPRKKHQDPRQTLPYIVWGDVEIMRLE